MSALYTPSELDYLYGYLPEDAYQLFGGDAINLNLDIDLSPSQVSDLGGNDELPFLASEAHMGYLPVIDKPSPARVEFYTAESSGSLRSSSPGQRTINSDSVTIKSNPSQSETIDARQDAEDNSVTDSIHGRIVRPSKRRWEDSVILFPKDKEFKASEKKRRNYSPGRRSEVARQREIGACNYCKLKKTSCDFGIPCEKCINRAGGKAFGQEICVKQSLHITRFNNVDLFQHGILEEEMKGLNNNKVVKIVDYACLWWPNQCGQTIPVDYLVVPVVRFKRPGFTLIETQCYVSYSDTHRSQKYDTCYAISPQHLPSVDNLFCCLHGFEWLFGKDPSPFGRLHVAMQNFAKSYCHLPNDLPLQTLLARSLRLTSMFEIFRRMPVLVQTLCSGGNHCISSAIWLQLRIIVSKEITQCEARILSDIDKLVFGQESIGRRNSIATWVCLWILILCYKQHMIFTKGFVQHDNKPYEVTRHIYNTLTSIYAAIYKTTSPLTIDWRIEENASVLGQDTELIKLFCNVKTEMFWFNADRDRLVSEDLLFKKLVVENETKLLAKHIKVAKQKGIL